jgi:hypothetical protein
MMFFSLLCDNYVRPEESIFSEKCIVQNKVRVDNLRHVLLSRKLLTLLFWSSSNVYGLESDKLTFICLLVMEVR